MKNKLKSLGYENQWIGFDDFEEIKNLVKWIENAKVRFYEAEKRGNLVRNDVEENVWMEAYKGYLVDLECKLVCPKDAKDTVNWRKTVDFLLNKAMQLEYDDHAKEINSAQTSLFNVKQEGIVTVDEEFGKNVHALAALLGISTSNSNNNNNNNNNNEENIALLQSCANLIIRKFSQSALQKAFSNGNNNNDNEKDSKNIIPLDQFHLGFSTGDALVDNAVRVLHLLYITDLRVLQKEINRLIAAMQAYTADPKTDASLGKVGR